MRTIETTVYTFDELSEEAKENAINKWRIANQEGDYHWFVSDANESFKLFADLFSINWSIIDYEEPSRNEYRLKFNDDILELTGQRLATYIWNNYKNDLFKGKYYHTNKFNTDKKLVHKRVKNTLCHNGNYFNAYYSAITLDNCCVLTGVCYDDDLLTPIYEFLDKPKNLNIETLLNDCIYSLCHSVSSEIDYQNSDEAIIETINCNDYEFEENGDMI